MNATVRPAGHAASEPSHKLRIGILIALLPPEGIGGAELQAERLSRELAARGHDVHLFARGRGWRPALERRDGVCIHRRPVVPIRGLRLAVEVLSGSMQAGRRGLDVLLCFMTFNSGLVGYASHRVGRMPFVIWQRLESEARLRPSTWLTRMSGYLNARATEIWVQSERVARTLEQEYRGAGQDAAWRSIAPRVRVLGNGVDLPDLPADEAPPPLRFLFLGRLVEQKNLFTLIEAARGLRDGEVWIAGSGPLEEALHEAAAGAPVRFLGAQPHNRVAELIRQCRALVLCSHDEGLPNAVLEALAQGRPVIATPVGALPELIEDGVNGRLVAVNDVAALRRAFDDLEDDEKWTRLARAAQPSVARYAWPELVARVESALRDIVSGGA